MKKLTKIAIRTRVWSLERHREACLKQKSEILTRLFNSEKLQKQVNNLRQQNVRILKRLASIHSNQRHYLLIRSRNKKAYWQYRERAKLAGQALFQARKLLGRGLVWTARNRRSKSRLLWLTDSEQHTLMNLLRSRRWKFTRQRRKYRWGMVNEKGNPIESQSQRAAA